jgi:hypothetical protein
MQDYSHNITAYHHARLSAVVNLLIRDFNTAYSQIVNSEPAYAAAITSLLEAVAQVPTRLTSVLDTLGGYEAMTAGVMDSELKAAADQLFRALNTSISIGGAAIETALPVSCCQLSESGHQFMRAKFA